MFDPQKTIAFVCIVYKIKQSTAGLFTYTIHLYCSAKYDSKHKKRKQITQVTTTCLFHAKLANSILKNLEITDNNEILL